MKSRGYTKQEGSHGVRSLAIQKVEAEGGGEERRRGKGSNDQEVPRKRKSENISL